MNGIMDKYDRRFIAAMLCCIFVVLFLMNVRMGKLSDGLEQLAVRVVALEQINEAKEIVSRGHDIGRSYDATSKAYGVGNYGGFGKSCIDTPTGDWDPIKNKSIGIIFGKPFHIDIPISHTHTSDPLPFPRNSVRMFSH